jgi:hypothetical protein
MTGANSGDLPGPPTVAVRVFRRGAALLSEWCDSVEDAADAVERWSQLRDVHCEVEDLATGPSTGDRSSAAYKTSP